MDITLKTNYYTENTSKVIHVWTGLNRLPHDARRSNFFLLDKSSSLRRRSRDNALEEDLFHHSLRMQKECKSGEAIHPPRKKKDHGGAAVIAGHFRCSRTLLVLKVTDPSE